MSSTVWLGVAERGGGGGEKGCWRVGPARYFSLPAMTHTYSLHDQTSESQSSLSLASRSRIPSSLHVSPSPPPSLFFASSLSIFPIFVSQLRVRESPACPVIRQPPALLSFPSILLFLVPISPFYPTPFFLFFFFFAPWIIPSKIFVLFCSQVSLVSVSRHSIQVRVRFVYNNTHKTTRTKQITKKNSYFSRPLRRSWKNK